MATEFEKETSIVRPQIKDSLSSNASDEHAMSPTAKARSSMAALRAQLREPLAEYLGTCVMVLFLQGVVAQVVLSNNTHGAYWAISVITGTAATLGVLIAGPVSGGHLNPSVTLAFVVYRQFPIRKALAYFVAQMLGGFTGAALVYANYRSAIDAFEGHGVRTHLSAVVFSTYPQEYLTKTGQFFSEFIATAILVIGILSIFNPRSPKVIHDMAPLWLWILIMSIGAALGWETGYAMNMARDLAPRCLAYLVGYGQEVWTYGDYYAWVPVVAPLCGSLVGGLVYDCLIFDGTSPVNQPWMGMWPLPWVNGPAQKNNKHGLVERLPECEEV